MRSARRVRSRGAHPLAAVLVLLALATSACSREPAPPASGPAVAAPDRENWDVRYGISHDGAQRVLITAPYMAFYDHSDSAYTVVSGAPDAPGGRVTVRVFDGGDLAATVEADRVRHPEDTDRYLLSGSVVVTTPAGRRLETDDLVWFESRREVETEGFVRITSPTERIQGYNLVADEDLESYTLARISGEVEVEE